MKKSLLAVAALTFSGAAFAGPPWTYVDAGYVIASQDGGAGTDGYRLRGSFGLELFHFGGEYGEIDGLKGSTTLKPMICMLACTRR